MILRFQTIEKEPHYFAINTTNETYTQGKENVDVVWGCIPIPAVGLNRIISEVHFNNYNYVEDIVNVIPKTEENPLF